MNNNINLLDYRSKIVNVKKENKHTTLRIVAVGLLFTASACSIVIFILIALSPLPELAKQRETAALNLSVASSDMVKLAIINERVESISKVLGARSSYGETIENFQSLLPPGVSVESIKMQKGELIIVVSSNSLLRIENFLNELVIAKDTKSQFKNIQISTLSADATSNKFLLSLDIDTL